MPFFHDRKLEDFVLRKKQHKEPQWTGRLLFYFLKSIYIFLIKIMVFYCRIFTVVKQIGQFPTNHWQFKTAHDCLAAWGVCKVELYCALCFVSLFLFLYFYIIFILCVCVYACTMAWMWMSEDNLRGSSPSTSGPGNLTQVIRRGRNHVCALSCLTSSVSPFKI